MEIQTSVIHHDSRGRLEVIQGLRASLRNFSRFFIISDVSEGVKRGSHAHRTQTQAFFVLTGSCLMKAESKDGAHEIQLSQDGRCHIALPMTWVELSGFSHDCRLLILSEGDYDKADYIHDYDQFRIAMKETK